jgi:hypothetical protein
MDWSLGSYDDGLAVDDNSRPHTPEYRRRLKRAKTRFTLLL